MAKKRGAGTLLFLFLVLGPLIYAVHGVSFFVATGWSMATVLSVILFLGQANLFVFYLERRPWLAPMVKGWWWIELVLGGYGLGVAKLSDMAMATALIMVIRSGFGLFLLRKPHRHRAPERRSTWSMVFCFLWSLIFLQSGLHFIAPLWVSSSPPLLVQGVLVLSSFFLAWFFGHSVPMKPWALGLGLAAILPFMVVPDSSLLSAIMGFWQTGESLPGGLGLGTMVSIGWIIALVSASLAEETSFHP